jgi:hypothetical protein
MSARWTWEHDRGRAGSAGHSPGVRRLGGALSKGPIRSTAPRRAQS